MNANLITNNKEQSMNNTTIYKVLFLEDEPTIREVLTEYMLISGYNVTAVERGDGARSGWFCGVRIY